MKEIRSDILLTELEYLQVEIPSADCILADKLTAFSPHTTLIPLNEGKDKEVMKLMYDVCSLLDVFNNFDNVKKTYNSITKAEITCRKLS